MSDELNCWYQLNNNIMIPQPGDPPGAKITSGPASWQVIQRGPDGAAEVTIAGHIVRFPNEPVDFVTVRVVREYDGSSPAGCGWQDAEMLGDGKWRANLRIPTGGPYTVESRLGRYNPGDRIMHVFVGDVWVIAGQSNAVGCGHGTVVDLPMIGVSLFGMDDRWRLAAHPVFDPTGTKHPANYDTGWVGSSPWLAFGKVILERAGVPVGLIPTALGGSPLDVWIPDGHAFLLHNMHAMIDAAGGKIAGIVWYQGCTDTHEPPTSCDYLERFTRFLNAVRAEHGGDLPIITAQLNRYTDAPPERQESWSRVREAQRKAAHEIPNLAVVPTLDIQLSDSIHNSAVGSVQLGQRFGAAALGMVYGKEEGWQFPDISRLQFSNAERTSINLDFDHVHGDFWTIYINIKDDFEVRDSSGVVPISDAKQASQGRIAIELERPAVGPTVCSYACGSNPKAGLRDEDQRPILAFHRLPVTDSERFELHTGTS